MDFNSENMMAKRKVEFLYCLNCLEQHLKTHNQTYNEMYQRKREPLESRHRPMGVHIDHLGDRIEEFESSDPVQSEDRMTVENWTESLSF
ncbi:hypothetical protein TNCV_2926841 [Trichonephila clavipes]|nr:hypothetical protein TNCV_2926841 [Trichonephila clavipes]